jgi:tetratricopeptide (TPR) repeat protein
VIAHQQRLHNSYNNLGIIYVVRGQFDKAEKAYQDSLAVNQKLVDTEKKPEHVRNLMMTYYNLAELYWRSGQLAKAGNVCRTSLALSQKLFDAYPQVAEYRGGLTASCLALADWHRLTWQTAAEETARSHLTEAEALLDKTYLPLQREAPAYATVTEVQDLLARYHHFAGLLYQVTGRLPQAEAALRKAVAVSEKLARERAAYYVMPWNCALDYGALGNLLGDLGKVDAALAAQDQARVYLEKVVQRIPQQALVRADLCQVQVNRAILSFQDGRYAGVDAALEQALTLDRGQWRHFLEFFRALVRARKTGQDMRPAYREHYAQATTEARTLAATWELSGNAFYVWALVFSLSAEAVAHENTLSPADRDQRAEQYAAQAMGFLTKAHAAGYFRLSARIKQLRQDQELAPLRTRADFRKLRQAVETEIQPDAR